tara:strand:- start:3895 stop:4143 length:249 start_codon:yes stop_codon:yes gene_type:complete
LGITTEKVLKQTATTVVGTRTGTGIVIETGTAIAINQNKRMEMRPKGKNRIAEANHVDAGATPIIKIAPDATRRKRHRLKRA